jgi:hypothetical protein
MKMTAFWDIAPFSLIEADRRFRHAYFLSSGRCFIAVMMEVLCTNETLVYFNEITGRYIPKSRHLLNPRLLFIGQDVIFNLGYVLQG